MTIDQILERLRTIRSEVLCLPTDGRIGNIRFNLEDDIYDLIHNLEIDKKNAEVQ